MDTDDDHLRDLGIPVPPNKSTHPRSDSASSLFGSGAGSDDLLLDLGVSPFPNKSTLVQTDHFLFPSTGSIQPENGGRFLGDGKVELFFNARPFVDQDMKVHTGWTGGLSPAWHGELISVASDGSKKIYTYDNKGWHAVEDSHRIGVNVEHGELHTLGVYNENDVRRVHESVVKDSSDKAYNMLLHNCRDEAKEFVDRLGKNDDGNFVSLKGTEVGKLMSNLSISEQPEVSEEVIFGRSPNASFSSSSAFFDNFDLKK